MSAQSEIHTLKGLLDGAGDLRQNHVRLAPIMESAITEENFSDFLSMAFHTRDYLSSIGISFPAPDPTARTQTLQTIDARLVRSRHYIKQGFFYV